MSNNYQQYQINGKQYNLIKRLGQGQFGDVFLLEDSAQNKFALKIIKKDKLQKIPQLLQYTQSEIEIMEQIKHPNIMELVSSQKMDGTFFLVLEYCEGGDLRQHIQSLIKKKELSFEQISREFLEILDAFDVLHSNHIIHRDVKPDNILYKNGHPKVSDFGFSKNIQQQDDIAATTLGTPQTMAPEVLERKNYTYSADIYGLGFILYFMIYQKYPFNSVHYELIVEQIKKQKINFPESGLHVDEDIKQIIKRMLSYNPQLRPSIDEIRQIPYFKKLRKEEEQNIIKMNMSKLSIQALQIVDNINQGLQKIQEQLYQEEKIENQQNEENQEEINKNQNLFNTQKLNYYQINLEKLLEYQNKMLKHEQQLEFYDQSFIYTADDQTNVMLKQQIQEGKMYLLQFKQIIQINQIIDQILNDLLNNFKSKYEEEIKQFALFLYQYFYQIEKHIQVQLQSQEIQKCLNYDLHLLSEYQSFEEMMQKKQSSVSESSLFNEPSKLSNTQIEKTIQYCQLFQNAYYELSQQQKDDKNKDEYYLFQLNLSILTFFLLNKINLNNFNFSNYIETIYSLKQEENSSLVSLFQQ
ncbi:Serine/Threonine kinase domain protein (macronuclear) [Tetrahymena thermophila SB210]|uniref:Serine/Threonine kinase domain protein n=1 Tax=Tetrahymena thermophila (strain SB210) TaxID=312017 RepID=I7MDA1_TETTS|nr:Serine/Threonine kinase domain protein [Tetrahymena thermophila SB210]EAR86057.2 Serine/Threonine kinase domain protein [Tetrahymena thermophila SB210]|eukprot:XP_976652.2 Serine/Threonine kinase domain protein [Tetrahymena thermophila SB210]